MAIKESTLEADISTEIKIRNAARIVFHKKGFAATRTRDIAEEAGINLALLNYYFRSKEKLFQLIMLDTLASFMESMVLVYNDKSTSLEQKVVLLSTKYIDLLLVEPEIPLFLMSELRNNPAKLFEKINVKDMLLQSHLYKQIEEAMIDNKMPSQNSLHFLTNIMSLIMFPFIASPMLKMVGNMNDAEYLLLMEERKTLIPKWIKASILT